MRVAANKGRPIEIGFEDRADNTVVPTGPYSTQWGNYFGEMIRSIPLYHPSWQKVPAGDKARLMVTLGPHIEIVRWPRIEGYFQAQAVHTEEYKDDEWEKDTSNFWNDPCIAQRAETLYRTESVPMHSEMTSATQEEPSEDRHVPIVPHNVTVYSRILRLSGFIAELYRHREDAGGCRFHEELDEERQQGSGMRLLGMILTFPSGHVAWEDTATVNQFLDQIISGVPLSLRDCRGDCFAIELTPINFSQRHFAGGMFPQLHVAGEKVGMLLGKASNVVVFASLTPNVSMNKN
ncbi:hypothetical protein Tco_1418237 [Tanacetum coccineum]